MLTVLLLTSTCMIVRCTLVGILLIGVRYAVRNKTDSVVDVGVGVGVVMLGLVNIGELAFLVLAFQWIM